jgi:hypothetical protein
MRLASILRRLLPVMERVGVATAVGVEIDGRAAMPGVPYDAAGQQGGRGRNV